MHSQVVLEPRLQQRISSNHTPFDGPATAALRRSLPSAAYLPSIDAGLSYLRHADERPYNCMYEPPPGIPGQNCEYELHRMPITDARTLSPGPSVHREGFELWDAPSAVKDFLNEEEIVSVYYKEMAGLACAATGAQRAYLFDHLVRKREVWRHEFKFGRHGNG